MQALIGFGYSREPFASDIRRVRGKRCEIEPLKRTFKKIMPPSTPAGSEEK
jgi:hypothetical protein